jgi:hypothetical protein
MTDQIIHRGHGRGDTNIWRTACGVELPKSGPKGDELKYKNVTYIPAKVTCPSCKKTRAENRGADIIEAALREDDTPRPPCARQSCGLPSDKTYRYTQDGDPTPRECHLCSDHYQEWQQEHNRDRSGAGVG